MNAFTDLLAAAIIRTFDAFLSVCMVADDAVASVRGGVS